jgi:hypothetical protein
MYVLVTNLLGNHRQNISLAQTKALQALVIYSLSISTASAGMTAHKPMAAPNAYTDRPSHHFVRSCCPQSIKPGT